MLTTQRETQGAEPEFQFLGYEQAGNLSATVVRSGRAPFRAVFSLFLKGGVDRASSRGRVARTHVALPPKFKIYASGRKKKSILTSPSKNSF